MATQPISLTVNGEEQINLAITRVSKSMQDFTKPVKGKSLWDRMRTAFQEAEQELFQTRGSTGRSGAWKPLSPKYKAWKAKHYPGAGILVASGAMRASLVGVTGDTVWKATKSNAEVGTNRLANYHWSAAGGRPARRAIDIGDEQERALFGRAMAEWANDVRKEWET